MIQDKSKLLKNRLNAQDYIRFANLQVKPSLDIILNKNHVGRIILSRVNSVSDRTHVSLITNEIRSHLISATMQNKEIL